MVDRIINMDISGRFVCIDQISSEHMESVLDKNTIVHADYQTAPVREVICPAPRRTGSASYSAGNLGRSCSRSRSNTTMHKEHFVGQDAGFEILDIISSKDDPEDNLEKGNHLRFFCGSPPVRTSNPLVNDAQFGRQPIPIASSPLGTSHGVKSTARVDRVTICAVSFGGKPMVRIEGFTSRKNSDSHCIVPALA